MARDLDPRTNGAKLQHRPRIREFLRSIVLHRLTHFFVLGGFLFAVAPAQKNSRHVRVDPKVLAALEAEEAKKLGKSVLTADEMQQVKAQAVEDEVLYREALRLRIAEGDVIVRQRLVQKLLVLAEDIEGASEPLTDAALEECFAKTKEQWTLPASIQFLHVVATSRDVVAGLREKVVAFSAEPGHENEVPPFGESFATSRRVTATLDEVGHSFGNEFARAVAALPLRTWSDPITSKYGVHLVHVLAYTPDKPAALNDVRGKLTVDCQLRRREDAVRHYVERVFRDYDVYIGDEKVRAISPTHRTAPRGEMSREDE